MTLNWAIIGTGFISHKVIDGISRSDGSQLRIIAGRNPDTLEKFQSQHGIPETSTDFESVLARPDIDAVYIGLPNHVHHTLTIAAAKHGKAVLSEKSLCTTMADADALLKAVRDNGTFFVEGLMYLAHPTLHRFVNLLKDGRIGSLKSVSAHYAADIWQFVNPKGMGTIYNLGCYPVSLLQVTLQTLCGEAAFGNRQLQGLGTLTKDDTIGEAICNVRFENGVLATLHSTDNYGTSHGFSVCGSKGVLSFVTNPWQPVAGRSHIKWSPFDGDSEDIFVSDDHDAFYHQVKMVECHVHANDSQAARPSPRQSDSHEIMQFLTDWEAVCRMNT